MRFSRERNLTRVDPFEVSTCAPSAKPTAMFTPEDSVANLPISDFSAGLNETRWLGAVSDLVEQYPNYKPSKTATTPEKKLERAVRQVTDKVTWLHNQVESEIRDRSHLRYDGPRKSAGRMAKKYDLT